MSNCIKAVSGLASNFPSAPTRIVFGWALTVGRSCALASAPAKSNTARKVTADFIFRLRHASTESYTPARDLIEERVTPRKLQRKASCDFKSEPNRQALRKSFWP